LLRTDSHDLHSLKFAAGLLGKQLVCMNEELANVLATIRIGDAHAQLFKKGEKLVI